MLIDTHSHLNFSAYKNDLEETIKRTLAQDIWIINVGAKYESSKKAIEIAERYSGGVYAAIGMHPIHVKTGLVKIKTDPAEESFETSEEELDIEKYKELAKSKKVVAVGEVGLDYCYKPKTKKKIEIFKEKQKQVFLEQLELAQELDLPIILHCRMAQQDLIEILSSKIKTQGAKPQLKTQNYNLRGVIHCFTGTLEDAQKYLEMGFYIGLNGIIFKLNLDEIIKKIPLEKILVETDCPYLTPPQEDKAQGVPRNEPIFIKHIVDRIAEIKNTDHDTVAETTTDNARKLFNI